MIPKTTLPIHERFISFQGEGVHAGQKAFFIRTFGCPVKCPWCDSAGTWHKDYVPTTINRMEIADLVAEVVQSNPDFVVLTGGEPMVHPNLPELSAAIRREGYRVHVETCGAFYHDPSSFDWITVSPKRDKLPLKEMIHAAHEFKIIVDTAGAVEEWVEKLEQIGEGSFPNTPTFLHPEWSQSKDGEILNEITREVVARGKPFRAGWQLHKLFRADSLDPRTASLAPLGGNPSLGY